MDNSIFVYYNPNPTAKTHVNGKPCKWTKGDCVVRSLCKATNLPWKEVYTMLFNEGLKQCDMPNSDKVIDSVITGCGYVRETFGKSKKPTVKMFCNSHKRGTYILRIRSHMVTIVNGKIYDTWNCGEYAVTSYFKVA